MLFKTRSWLEQPSLWTHELEMLVLFSGCRSSFKKNIDGLCLTVSLCFCVKPSSVAPHGVYLHQSFSERSGFSLPQHRSSSSLCRRQRQPGNFGLYRCGERQHSKRHKNKRTYSAGWLLLLFTLNFLCLSDRVKVACRSSTLFRCPAAVNTGVSTNILILPKMMVCPQNCICWPTTLPDWSKIKNIGV